MRLSPTLLAAVVFALPLALFAPPVGAAPKALVVPPGATPREQRLGDEAAKAFEKSPQIKLLKPDTPKNKALLDKLSVMVRELGAASARPLIPYAVQVVEDPTVNAFTLPNGKVYVFRGLLDMVGSDDELAAVLSHEIGHNARMHALRGEKREKKLSLASLAAIAAMLAGGKTGGNVGAFSQYALMGIANGYTLGYEKEADEAAILQMRTTRYNPSAMVTVMQKFADQDARRPEIELGIFQDHPTSPERVQAALALLQRLKIPFRPRAQSGGVQAEVALSTDRATVKMGDLTLLQLALSGPNDEATRTRAETAAARVNALLRDGLRLPELQTQLDNGGVLLSARGQVIARCTPRDAALQQQTPAQTSAAWLQAFQTLFWREQLNGKFG